MKIWFRYHPCSRKTFLLAMTDEGKHNIYFAGNSWHCLNIYCLASLFIQIFSFIWGDSLTDGWIGKRLNKQPVLTGGKANTCLWLREHWGGLSFNVSLWSFFSPPSCFLFPSLFSIFFPSAVLESPDESDAYFHPVQLRRKSAACCVHGAVVTPRMVALPEVVNSSIAWSNMKLL